MIKTKTSVPAVYYNRSRDFQLLGRIYDVVFNYIYSNTAMINTLPLTKEIDDSLLDLVSTTLGFKYSPHYTTKQLRAVCSIFALALRNKGNILSIELAIYALLQAEGISDKPRFKFENNVLTVMLPKELEDTSLLLSVFDYILPAGIALEISKKTVVDADSIVDKFESIGNDNVGDNLTLKSVKMAIIPQYQSDVKVADVNAGRNDNMAIPTYGDINEE